jgi:predicted transcriptional regulator
MDDRYLGRQACPSIRELAGETGRSYGFVHRMLSESGVALRGRGGATRGKKS